MTLLLPEASTYASTFDLGGGVRVDRFEGREHPWVGLATAQVDVLRHRHPRVAELVGDGASGNARPVEDARRRLAPGMPTLDETNGLRLPDGVPVLVVLHTGLDQDRRPFEVTQFIMRADYSGLDYTMKVDE